MLLATSTELRSVLLAVLLGVVAAGCAAPDGSEVDSDSQIRGRPYNQIVDELKDLASRHAATAKYFNYGETLGKRELALIRIGREDLVPTGKRPAILITGSIHGDEFLNIEDRLPGWMLSEKDRGGVKKFLDSGGFVYIAPIMNPDGYSAVRRSNNRGVDLNRDFDLKKINKTGFTQTETRNLVNFVREQITTHKLDVKLTFDMHCCIGGVIYPWGYSETAKPSSESLKEHQRIGRDMIIANFPQYSFGRAYDVVGYVASGASDDFYYESFSSLSFTFEGEVKREKDKFDRHTKMWDGLLADRAGPAVATPSGPSSGLLTLAILAEDAKGLTLAAAADKGESMALCRGSPVACLASDAQIVTRFKDGRRVGGRTLFPAEQKLAGVIDGAAYTLVALGEGNSPIGSQGLVFVAR